MKISIVNSNQELLAEKTISERGYLFYEKAYQEGDRIQIELPCARQFLKVKIDDAMAETIIFVAGKIGILKYHPSKI